MPSINDWAAKVARQLRNEVSNVAGVTEREMDLYGFTEEHIAAVIALHAEPILTLLRERRREHFRGESDSYGEALCPRMFDGDLTDVCTCGADEWNARVDAAINGEQK